MAETSARPKRTRLSPAARTQQLLDTAKSMILDQGLQNFTMEALARTANVSSPLVYNYFSSRTELLRALLQTEYSRYARKLTEQLDHTVTFEDVVRVFIESNFDHHAHGNILPILDSQPEIAGAIEQNRAEHSRQIGVFLVKRTARDFSLTKSQAELVVRMSSSASIAAAEYSALGKMGRKKAVDTALAYIMAGIAQIAGRPH